MWATYKHQLHGTHPRLSWGFGKAGGRNASGVQTVRTKGSKLAKHRYWKLADLTGGVFTLSLVMGWQPKAGLGGALVVLKSAIGA